MQFLCSLRRPGFCARCRRVVPTAAMLFVIALFAKSSAAQPVLTTLNSFADVPHDRPLLDATGNVFVATYTPGATLGSVWELVNNGGTYTSVLLYSFSGSPDGALPNGGLVMDSAGNLFGTTVMGGTANQGTVFELVKGNGTYTERVLYSFQGNPGDGQIPVGP